MADPCDHTIGYQESFDDEPSRLVCKSQEEDAIGIDEEFTFCPECGERLRDEPGCHISAEVDNTCDASEMHGEITISLEKYNAIAEYQQLLADLLKLALERDESGCYFPDGSGGCLAGTDEYKNPPNRCWHCEAVALIARIDDKHPPA